MNNKRTTIGSLIYRRYRLDNKYEHIRNLLSGSDKSYEELIKTPSGRYSKPKIKKLVDELIGCLEDYRSYRKAQEHSAGAEMTPVKLDMGERKFYDAYFRMMIGLALYNNNGPESKMSEPGTWNALVERIYALPVYSDSAAMYRDIICYSTIGFLNDYPSRIPERICYDIMYVYSEITGNDLMDLISADDRKKAYKLMTGDEVDLIRKEEKKPGTIDEMSRRESEELNKAAEEYFNTEYDPDEYEPLEEDDFEIEYYLDSIPFYDEDKNVAKWHRYFSDKAGFETDCVILLENIVEKCRDHNLRDEAENAVHLYLAQKGITRWLDDDDYYTVYTYLNKALAASEKNLRRR